MRIVEQSYDKEIVLALGLFDSVHRGHVHLISEAKKLADDMGIELAVFTFRNNPFSYYGRDTKMVFTFEERTRILRNSEWTSSSAKRWIMNTHAPLAKISS